MYLYIMAVTHRADVHLSGGPGPWLSLSSRPLAVVSAVCPALLALVRAEHEHGDPGRRDSQSDYIIDSPCRAKTPRILTPVASFCRRLLVVSTG